MSSNLVPLQKKQIHIPAWIHRAIKQVALERDTTIETVAHEALESWLASQGIAQPQAQPKVS